MQSDSAGPGHDRSPAITLNDLDVQDLPDLNRVVAAAIETWDIAPRARRLALPAYLYRANDFGHFTFVGARDGDELLGFVAIEPVERRQAPEGRSAMLVHGLYVMPKRHGTGVGTRLIDRAKQVARKQGHAGLLVRAERNAVGFFEKTGFTPLPVEDQRRDYPHRLWAELEPAG